MPKRKAESLKMPSGSYSASLKDGGASSLKSFHDDTSIASFNVSDISQGTAFPHQATADRPEPRKLTVVDDQCLASAGSNRSSVLDTPEEESPENTT